MIRAIITGDQWLSVDSSELSVKVRLLLRHMLHHWDAARSDADQVTNLDAGHVLANYVADRRTRPIRRRQFCRTKWRQIDQRRSRSDHPRRICLDVKE